MVTNTRNIFILIILLVFTSCNKLQNQGCAEILPTDPIVYNLTACKNKEWKVISYKKNGEDILSGLEKCIKDNIDVYFCDHRFESVEGKTKCDKEAPYLRETGCWYFNEDSTEIEVTIGKDFYILKVLELSSDKFHYIYTHYDDTTETILKPSRM